MPESTSILQFSIDLNEQERPPELPAGTYPAEIISAERRHSEKTGNDYASFGCRIPADAYPADYEGDPDGTVLYFMRLIYADTPNVRWRWKMFCTNIGVPFSNKVDLLDTIGRNVNVVVEIQAYEGEPRASIRNILAP